MSPVRSHRPATVRSAALRRSALIFAKAISKSGYRAAGRLALRPPPRSVRGTGGLCGCRDCP